MPEKTTKKSNRDRYMERLSARYPDREFVDEEAIFGQVNDDYDSYDKELSQYRDREKSLSDLFASNPRSAAFLIDWRNGEDPIVNMLRKFGDDFKAALEDPDKQEEIAAANKEYADRIAREEEYEKQYRTNIKKTYETIDRVQKEDGLTDDEVDKAMEFLIGIMRDGLLGKFSDKSIRMAMKAMRHDSDVAMAGEEGEIRGRNTKIDEKLRRSTRNDGTASLNGKNSGGMPGDRERRDLGAIDRNYGTMNIWERGGEKRIPIRDK